MNICTWQWMVRMALLWILAWPGVGWAVEEGSPQDAAPAEEVGSRATPMLRPGLQNPQIFLVPKQLGTALVPQALPSCVKSVFTAAVVPSPVPSTHYYTIMPSSIRVSDAIRRTADTLAQFTLDATTYAMTPRPGASLNRPQFPENVELNAPVLQVFAQESANPPLSQLIGETQLHLPHGAIIREISIGVHDRSGKQNLLAEFQGSIGNGQGFIDIALESDCLALGTYGKMGMNNLAIPVDARQGRFLRLTLVPAKAPVPSPQSPSVMVDLITIGYTMP
ncbi:MAG: hypothetical protein Q8N00_17370 [Nitrospirota bacterium]|nr:hypothetical protein [Nitrospirota bacterium]